MAARTPTIAGPAALIALFAILAIAFASSVQASGLGVAAGGASAQADMGLAADAPLASPSGSLNVAPLTSLDVLTVPSLTSDLLGPTLDTGSLTTSLLGSDAPSTSTQSSSASYGSSASSAAARAAPAEVAAVGALAAAGTLALKLEPVRRGIFLLGLPLYSRLRRSQLLENGVRERIYRSIETNPGLSIIQVCRGAKVGWGTAVYHLQRLERDRMIASRRDGQYRRFFLNGQAPDPSAADPAVRALGHPLAHKIATFVMANPQAAQKDICVALGIAPPLASKWLGRLLEAGLLTSQREWKLVRYTPTSTLQTALAPALPA